MRYQLPAFGPGCDTKSWYVLPRRASRIRTEKLLREWWPMNDEPLIRLRPRKSKHGPNENPRKYMGILRSMLRIVQMSKRGQKTQGTHSAGGSGRAYRTFNQRVAVRVSYSANKNPGPSDSLSKSRPSPSCRVWLAASFPPLKMNKRASVIFSSRGRTEKCLWSI